jgi:putative DNA primase/helicase
VAGELPRVVNEAEDALIILGREIFSRGSMLVRPIMSKLPASNKRETESWQLIPIARPYLVETLTCAARFMKFDGRAKGFVPTDAPDRVADTYLSRIGGWKLPELSGVTCAPFLRRDGSLCQRPGYDPESGLLFKPGLEIFPVVSLQPSKADAVEALAVLDCLIRVHPPGGTHGQRTRTADHLKTDKRAIFSKSTEAETSKKIKWMGREPNLSRRRCS